MIHFLLDPVIGAIVLLFASLAASHFGRSGLARGIVIFTALFLAAVALLPLPQLIAKPLEDAYPRPTKLPAHIDGIVILSGGLRIGIPWTRNAPADTITAQRIMAGAELARRYPGARLIFSGASARDSPDKAVEFRIAEHTMQSLGVPPGRTIFERRSRNTWENLLFSKEIARPKPGETWILVTSALHMRRSMAIARHIGWTMIAWPSEYETASDLRYQPRGYASGNLLVLTSALHEWIGLATYWIRGRLA